MSRQDIPAASGTSPRNGLFACTPHFISLSFEAIKRHLKSIYTSSYIAYDASLLGGRVEVSPERNATRLQLRALFVELLIEEHVRLARVHAILLNQRTIQEETLTGIL